MRLLILSIFIICVVAEEKICKSGYHFWRPYNGTLPRDAFIAGLDENDQKNVVARVVLPDRYSWLIPAQLKEFSDHVVVGWTQGNTHRVNDFIEVLCTENPEKLNWVSVKRYADEIAQKCCFVQGGRGVWSAHTYNIYIGKGVSERKIYIGRIYRGEDWEGVHIVNGGNVTKIHTDFQVLTYDCDDNKEEPVPAS